MNGVDKWLFYTLYILIIFVDNTVLLFLTIYIASAKIKMFINVAKPWKKPVVFM